MKPRTQPTLPANRAFVVQLHADAKLEQGDITGRVEHIVSGRSTHFGSLEELTTFMGSVLTAQQQAEAVRDQEDTD